MSRCHSQSHGLNDRPLDGQICGEFTGIVETTYARSNTDCSAPCSVNYLEHRELQLQVAHGLNVEKPELRLAKQLGTRVL